MSSSVCWMSEMLYRARSPLRLPLQIVFLLLCLFAIPLTSGDGSSCSAGGVGGGTCPAIQWHNAADYSAAASTAENDAKRQRWAAYLAAISAAKASHRECNRTDCSCVSSRLQADLAPWQKDGISRELVQAALEESGGGVLYQVIGGKLYRSKACRFPARCEGIEFFLHQELRHLPDLEFVLNDSDYPQSGLWRSGPPLPIFSFSKVANKYSDILFPAWSFWAGGPVLNAFYPQGIGRWDKMRELLRTANVRTWPWDRKESQAFFRGSRTAAQRDPLILLSRASPHLVDAAYTKNQAWRSKADTLGADPVPEVSLEAHCRFKLLFNFRGVAASFRLRHVLLCGAAVLHVGSEWIEFFYEDLQPWIHYVPVPGDPSSLQEEVRQLLEFARAHDDVMREIGARGADFVWRHLDMRHVACYWRRLLRRYARLLRYKVTPEPGAQLL